MKRNQLMIQRLAVDAVLVAIYVVLSLLVIQFGGFKITFEHFPVILCAVLYGPVDAMLVGSLGELFNQLTSFGLTPTTGLWILPIIFRGWMVGLYVNLGSKEKKIGNILQNKISVYFLCVCILTGIGSSCLNTFALYVDSKLFGYYNYALVFGALFVRVLLGIITSIVIGLCIKPVVKALRNAHFI